MSSPHLFMLEKNQHRDSFQRHVFCSQQEFLLYMTNKCFNRDDIKSRVLTCLFDLSYEEINSILKSQNFINKQTSHKKAESILKRKLRECQINNCLAQFRQTGDIIKKHLIKTLTFKRKSDLNIELLEQELQSACDEELSRLFLDGVSYEWVSFLVFAIMKNSPKGCQFVSKVLKISEETLKNFFYEREKIITKNPNEDSNKYRFLLNLHDRQEELQKIQNPLQRMLINEAIQKYAQEGKYRRKSKKSKRNKINFFEQTQEIVFQSSLPETVFENTLPQTMFQDKLQVIDEETTSKAKNEPKKKCVKKGKKEKNDQSSTKKVQKLNFKRSKSPQIYYSDEQGQDPVTFSKNQRVKLKFALSFDDSMFDLQMTTYDIQEEPNLKKKQSQEIDIGLGTNQQTILNKQQISSSYQQVSQIQNQQKKRSMTQERWQIYQKAQRKLTFEPKSVSMNINVNFKQIPLDQLSFQRSTNSLDRRDFDAEKWLNQQWSGQQQRNRSKEDQAIVKNKEIHCQKSNSGQEIPTFFQPQTLQRYSYQDQAILYLLYKLKGISGITDLLAEHILKRDPQQMLHYFHQMRICKRASELIKTYLQYPELLEFEKNTHIAVLIDRLKKKMQIEQQIEAQQQEAQSEETHDETDDESLDQDYANEEWVDWREVLRK